MKNEQGRGYALAILTMFRPTFITTVIVSASRQQMEEGGADLFIVATTPGQ